MIGRRKNWNSVYEAELLKAQQQAVEVKDEEQDDD